MTTTMQNEPQTETKYAGICIHCGKPMIVPVNEMAGIAHKECVQSDPQYSANIKARKIALAQEAKQNVFGWERLLATALVEQRLRYVEQVEKLKWNHTVARSYLTDKRYNLAINDVLAILNGKDTNE